MNRVATGWLRTVFINAPPLMEHVKTVHEQSDAPDPRRFRELLKLVEPEREGYQVPTDGFGDIYRRSYRLPFRCDRSPEELIASVKAYPDRYCDPRLAKFHKTGGEPGTMKVGDRFVIAISGPWDGPVETIASDDNSFTFVTLPGHLEAGFIEFIATAMEGSVEFRIESWAASAGPLVWLTYSGLGITKKMQTKMWRHFCLKVAEVVGGDASGPLRISTACLGKPSELEAKYG